MGHAPNSNVELAPFVKQRFFQVFLNHPVRELQGGLDETGDVVDLVEDLDSLALILVGRLD